jgi:hypothetical protein
LASADHFKAKWPIPEVSARKFDGKLSIARANLSVVSMTFDRALSRLSDRELARLAQDAEIPFDAEQNATCAGYSRSTLLLDIALAGFTHRTDLNDRRFARR